MPLQPRQARAGHAAQAAALVLHATGALVPACCLISTISMLFQYSVGRNDRAQTCCVSCAAVDEMPGMQDYK